MTESREETILWNPAHSIFEFIGQSATAINRREGKVWLSLDDKIGQNPKIEIYALSRNFLKPRKYILVKIESNLLNETDEDLIEDIVEKEISLFGGCDFTIYGTSGRLQISGFNLQNWKNVSFRGSPGEGRPTSYMIGATQAISEEEAGTYSGLFEILGINNHNGGNLLSLNEEKLTEHMLTPKKLARAYRFAKMYIPDAGMHFLYSGKYNNRFHLEFLAGGKIELHKYGVSFFTKFKQEDFEDIERFLLSLGNPLNKEWNVRGKYRR